MDIGVASSWLLLVVSLPTQGATARMRVWRALQANGCAALRDGAYFLPDGGDREHVLQQLADECLREGGSAWLMSVHSRSEEETHDYATLFDRTDDYAEMRRAWKEANRSLSSLSPAEVTRLQRRLRREYEALRGIDFFPGLASAEAEAAWVDLNARFEATLSPDEPHDRKGRIKPLDLAAYRGRTWATRRHLWVDRVTFETLMASFGLEGDLALGRLGALVHQLDVGGGPVPEAGGFEAVMAGARERHAGNDDALLGEMSLVLDSLYVHFGREAGKARG